MNEERTEKCLNDRCLSIVWVFSHLKQTALFDCLGHLDTTALLNNFWNDKGNNKITELRTILQRESLKS